MAEPWMTELSTQCLLPSLYRGVATAWYAERRWRRGGGHFFPTRFRVFSDCQTWTMGLGDWGTMGMWV